MGNNICQCKIICQNLKEADLSSNKSAKKYNSKKININKNNNDLLKRNKEIENIYKNNCVKKIVKAYLAYKKRKKDNFEKYSNGMPYNKRKEELKLNNNNIIQNGANNNIEYSMNHPFYIDKVHCTKTNYEKIDIPKINKGMSLEKLLNKDSNNDNKLKHKKNKYNHI